MLKYQNSNARIRFFGACTRTLERGAGGSKRPSCLSIGGPGRAKVPFLKSNNLLAKHCYDRAEIKQAMNNQYLIGKDNDL